MDWIPLSLLCAFTLAAADACSKLLLPGYRGWEMVAVRLGVPALIMLPGALLYPIPSLSWTLAGWMLVLVPLELIAMLLYMLAIRDSPLYLTLPYLAFTPVFNVAVGQAVLGETVSGPGLAGIALVALGAYLLNLEPGGFAVGSLRAWVAPLQSIVRERGSRFMLGAAAIYSLTSVLGKRAMLEATPQTFGLFYFTVVGLSALAVLALLAPASLRVLRRRPGAHLLIGVLMATMVITHFLAIARTEAAYMIAVKRTSLLFGIVFGAFLFRERQLGRHLAAGALMLAGVVLIALQS